MSCASGTMRIQTLEVREIERCWDAHTQTGGAARPLPQPKFDKGKEFRQRIEKNPKEGKIIEQCGWV